MRQRGDVVDGVLIAHIKRIVTPHHHSLSANGLDEKVQGRHRMEKGIEAKQFKVIARRSLDIYPRLGPYPPTMLPAAANVRARAAAMGEIKFQARKLFEHAAENQARRSHRGVARVADQVLQVIRAQPLDSEHG